jgi:hypothetical protein
MFLKTKSRDQAQAVLLKVLEFLVALARVHEKGQATQRSPVQTGQGTAHSMARSMKEHSSLTPNQSILGGRTRNLGKEDQVILIPLHGIGIATSQVRSFPPLSQAPPLMVLGFLVGQARHLEMELLINPMSQWLIGLVPHPEALSQAAPLMDLECQVDLHKCPDQVSIQMLPGGIGHVGNHRSPCQYLEVLQRKNQLSQGVQALCHVRVQKSNLTALVLIGQGPSLLMM